MDITQLADEPELVVTIAGREYRFSELTIAALARLQSWIRAHTVHPLDAIREHLGGLRDEERDKLLERARVEAAAWPPQLGTPAGALALLGTEAGQIEALFEALAVHQKELSYDDARRLYRRLKKDAKRTGETTVTRIFGIAFGVDIDEANAIPKASGIG
jgi:hypothetical protein